MPRLLTSYIRAALAVPLLLAVLAQDANAQDDTAQATGDRHALVIGGLGGGADQTKRFEQYMFETRRALIETFGFEEANVRILGEQAIADRPFVDGVSLAETVRDEFAALGRRVGPDDQVYVILFGHGSSTGDRSFLNIPRRDLSDEDYAGLVGSINAARIVFVNTASASAPFAEAVSGSGRIVITATRIASQRNETTFPRYFVEALSSPAADRDRNGELSVLEVFRYAAEKTDQSFADANHVPTENALLEDTADRVAHRLEDLESSGEGNLAAVTFLTSRTRMMASVISALSDSVRHTVEGFFVRREQLNEEIALTKSRKSVLDEDAYYTALEVLFIELARTEASIEAIR